MTIFLIKRKKNIILFFHLKIILIWTQMDNIRGLINQSFNKKDALESYPNQILLELTHQNHLEVVLNHKTLLNLVVTVASYIIIVIQFSSGVEEE